MSWFKKLFGATEPTADDPFDREIETPPMPKKKSGFTIEHYPETGRYYPVYRGNYIKKNYGTGIYELREPFLFMFADYGKTEDDADRIIALFKEQQLKENVKVIER